MKINHFLQLICLIPVISFSQIGINTNNPQSFFHIDANSGTVTDDVTFSKLGNLGIGIINSDHKLEVFENSLIEGNSIVTGNFTGSNLISMKEVSLGTKNSTTISKSSMLDIYASEKGKGLKLDMTLTNDNPILSNNFVPVLTMDPTSKMLKWINLPLATTTVTSSITNRTPSLSNQYAFTASTWQDIPNATLTLDKPGKWFIFAAIQVMNSTLNATNSNAYLGVVSLYDATNSRLVTRAGTVTEKSGYKVGIINMVHFMNVTSPTNLKLQFYCGFPQYILDYQGGFAGKPQFYAVYLGS